MPKKGNRSQDQSQSQRREVDGGKDETDLKHCLSFTKCTHPWSPINLETGAFQASDVGGAGKHTTEVHGTFL